MTTVPEGLVEAVYVWNGDNPIIVRRSGEPRITTSDIKLNVAYRLETCSETAWRRNHPEDVNA